MDDSIDTFLAFTATDDPALAKQFLDVSGGNLEYAVQLYMESGSNQAAPLASRNDEELAQRLQLEAYEDNGVREADANVHRHETLLDSFPAYDSGVDHARAIFGAGRVGIFNQRFDEDGDYGDQFDENLDMNDSESEDQIVELHLDEEEENIIEVDLDEEPISQPNRRLRTQRERLNELTSTQRRLAELFKPPFDLILRTSLDGARKEGREQKKWILVNIQDPTEFQCQVLNRDFWSDPSIKEIVRSEFIFLQYQNDSPHGQSYLNFYSVDSCPHISILDPMTGERVFKWSDGVVPNVEEWVSDVELFLEKFSLLPGSSNPVVKHDVKIDPDAMTEEQQIEYAMKQSMGGSAGTIEKASSNSGSDNEMPLSVEESLDPFEAIEPKKHAEPGSSPLTRVQIRFPNGKRLIHKFDPEKDTVLTLYQWLKYVLSETEESEFGIGNEGFTISCAGKPKLLDCISQTIKEAGLANASILLEKI
ncbi:hypothetical protein METBIDRAFT_45295 [Metschnikowia bicuspidata var. bicuspidata NRRL YB-4993]|uniref:UBX domain-containing protein n=1 Tax=Metschnikowia bicuspidata var. bicuspidata NRRL YB-4993 TaxID=869754 RepID=A0A1A0H7V0_9ASCO|nr:hypothetical protein METBIDRAFT_45295 [Metschnikowia bicuspidata var. bicuspidata NRRL YB-4993]OBA20101.1 hypothetical protein METBIDRAFT_45295 [Metschnikowia bicuspidata var. bicuspidata NRRL YB-4993]